MTKKMRKALSQVKSPEALQAFATEHREDEIMRDFFKEGLECQNCRGKIPDEKTWDEVDDAGDEECPGHSVYLEGFHICGAFEYMGQHIIDES